MLSASFVLKSLSQATPPKPAGDAVFDRVNTDSRVSGPGELFVALKGDNVDGHDFIEAAVARGASGVLCGTHYKPLPNPGVTWFQVPDTLAGFRELAAAWRRTLRIPVIAVAGSVGKTTTKELLASCLEGRWPDVFRTRGSQNGFVGIPMSLLSVRPEHGVAVIEVGIDEPGTMIQHMEVVRPDGAVLTAIGPEHLEKLIDLETVAREESIALSWTAEHGGFIAVNLDDPWIARMTPGLDAPKALGFMLAPTGVRRAPAGGAPSGGAEIVVATQDPSTSELVLGTGERIPCPLPGTHNARNTLAACAVALQLGLTPDEIRRGLKGFKAATGRTEILETGKGLLVLADHYNANPSSVAAALGLLAELKVKRAPKGSTWACLADMLELGPDEERFHRDVAQGLIDRGVDHVLLYGPRMKALADELPRRGFRGTVAHFDSHDALAENLLKEIREGDVVLIKGSRGMKMEKVLERIRSSG